ncbi:MAG: 30S ribosomal protein S12 methylthiotransferase RimO [Desulfatibacillum sp.]|nr:30S ribosomal protein S12 methylthiotransferase RimO [Desulfatibacillum sp.]
MSTPVENQEIVHLVSLGCVRNLVDSELILGNLAAAGFAITEDPAQAGIIIVNSCGFVRAAVDETIDTVLEMAQYKEDGECQRLVLCGCMAQRYGKDLEEALPEVDIVLGPGAHHDLVSLLRQPGQFVCQVPDPSLTPLQEAGSPRICSTPHMAYIKISEGCPDRCTFCMIPQLRGAWRSRPLQDIVEEARNLVNWGAKELILVAQDTTAYGLDFDKQNQSSLAELLNNLCTLDGDCRFRFLYGHPNRVTGALLDTVASQSRVCSYFDLPVQHGSDRILKKMGRRNTRDEMIRLFEKIRFQVPDVALRSTALVGFPGETEEDYNLLVDFVQEVRFDHLGVFAYSDAEELPSHHLPDHVPEEVALKRQEFIMDAQNTISLDNNADRVGKIYTALIQGPCDDPDYPYWGRTCLQAPDVDGVTLIQGEGLVSGEMIRVSVHGADVYDLLAETED